MVEGLYDSSTHPCLTRCKMVWPVLRGESDLVCSLQFRSRTDAETQTCNKHIHACGTADVVGVL